MRTFILPWDPSVSQYKMSDFEAGFQHLEYGDFTWKLAEDSAIRSGDNFFLVKSGGENKGIVMKGFFITDPVREDADTVVKFRPSVMLHPDNEKSLVTLEHLEAVLDSCELTTDAPEFLLDRNQSASVDELWRQCLSNFSDEDFDSDFLQKDNRPVGEVDDAVCIISEALYDMKDETGEVLMLRSLRNGLAGKTELEMICGFLQDLIVVDNYYSMGMIREKGFSEEVADRLLELKRVLIHA